MALLVTHRDDYLALMIGQAALREARLLGEVDRLQAELEGARRPAAEDAPNAPPTPRDGDGAAR